MSVEEAGRLYKLLLITEGAERREREQRIRTHSQACVSWHDSCAIRFLLGEVSRLRDKDDQDARDLSGLRKTWPKNAQGHPRPAEDFWHELPCPSCGLQSIDGRGACVGCGRSR